MPSCERIPPHEFHSRESRLHTDSCVRELMRGDDFKRYINHKEYDEFLQFTWFIPPIGLMVALYYHLVFILQNSHAAPLAGFEPNAPFLLPVTMLLFFFVAPCVMIAPFCGFFEPLSRRQAWHLVALFTCINVAVVSFGGKWFHHPPFLPTEPLVPWFTSRPSEAKQLFIVTLTRALPLQGGIVAGWLVYEWRRVRWKSAWNLPLPLITVPVLVGFFVCLWFRIASALIAECTSSLPSILSSLSSTVDGADGAVRDVVTGILSMFSVIKQETLDTFSLSLLSVSLANPWLVYHVWCATLSLAVLCFVGLLLSSFLFVFNGIFSLLPTHPTTWGLMVVSCIVGIWALMHGDSGTMTHVLGLLTLLCMLLLNGFTITYW